MNALATSVCPRCQGPLERGDLRCALCALAVPAPAVAVAALVAQIVRCQGCGAAVSYDVRARAPRCAFCGEVMRVESVEDPLEQAEAALPFTVAPEAARAALKGWLKTRGFFRPGDLAAESTVATLQPLFWPAWVVDARGEVSWAADSDADAGRAKWAPHAGQLELTFEEIVVPASRGLSHAECAALSPHFDTLRASPTPEGPEGTVTEQFDVQRSTARSRILDAVHALTEARLRSGVIPGTSLRNLHASVLLRGLRARRLSMPTYVFAYRYKGKLYRALVHGQDAQVVFGTAPFSWAKVLGVTAAALAALALILVLLAR